MLQLRWKWTIAGKDATIGSVEPDHINKYHISKGWIPHIATASITNSDDDEFDYIAGHEQLDKFP